MTIALVAHVAAGDGSGGTSVTTSGVDTSGASLLVAIVGWYGLGGGTSVISDNYGNTWTALATYGIAEGSTTAVTMFYCANPTVGMGHTFTASGTGLYPSVGVEAFSGAAASPLDASNGASDSTGGSTLQPGSVSPVADGEVIVTGIYAYPYPVTSIDSGFTITDNISPLLNLGLAYLIQGAKSPVNPTWTLSNPSSRTAAIATFKVAASGGVVPQPYYTMLLGGSGGQLGC